MAVTMIVEYIMKKRSTKPIVKYLVADEFGVEFLFIILCFKLHFYV